MRKSKKRSKRDLVSLIILNYNGKDDTLEFLRSIKKTDYPNYEIIVVDNASTDDSVKTIRKKFPKVKIFQNKRNLGFSGGMNSGIKKSKGKYVVLLNNDMEVAQKEWLSLLVEAAESDERAGIVIPMVLYYHTNTIESVGKVVPNVLTKITFTALLLGRGEKDRGQFSKKIEIDYGNGLIKRGAFEKIGLLDEKMFVYFEELDFCYRAKRAGYRTICEPRAKIWHKGYGTVKKGSYFAIYHSYKNKLRFILKNYGPFTKPLAIGFNLFYYTYLIMSYALTNRPHLSKGIIDGIIWNCKNWKDYI